MKNILIVGGGPAGATAARYLAKHFDVTLIQDKKDFEKPCGGGVKTKVFKQFHLNKDLIIHQIDKIFMHFNNQEIPIDLKGNNLSIVSRRQFDAHLRELAKQAGAKIHYGRLKDIKDNTAIINIYNLKFKFKFDILIAADGVNSTVRKILNLPPIPYVLTYYTLANLKSDTCHFYFDKEFAENYYAWRFPHKELSHIGTPSKETFLNFCKFLNITPKKIKGYKIPLWEENITYQKDNIYFVGDAAGQVMPLSFEGIYYAMHSAKILAHSITYGLDYKREWENRFLNEFKLLRSLQNLMNKEFSRNIILYLQKLSLIKNLSVNMWLNE